MRQPILILSPSVWGPPGMVVCRSISALFWAPEKAGVSQKKGDKIRVGCLTFVFRGAQKRQKCHITPAFSGVWKQRGSKSELAVFWGAQNMAEMLCHPCILGGPQTTGGKIRIGCLSLAFSGGAKGGGNATSPLHSRGSPDKGGRNQNWLGTPQNAGVTQHFHPLLGPREGRGEAAISDFVPLCFRTPENAGVT